MTPSMRLCIVFVAAFVPFCSPAHSDLPQAPAPRPKVKTHAELLVGTWQMVKLGEMELQPGVRFLIEFTGDGKFAIRSRQTKRGIEKKTGTYVMVGDTIRFTSIAEENQPETTWDLVIEVIDDEGLTLAFGSPNTRERDAFKRLKPQ